MKCLVKATGLRMSAAIDHGANRFVYVYDYDDNWRHEVIVERVHEGDPRIEYPTFMEVARRCPPEAVGVPESFMDCLE